MARVQVVVVAWNGGEMLWRCLSALSDQQALESCIIWVVDNASSDDTPAVLECLSLKIQQRRGTLRVIRSDRNLGYTGGANLGMRAILEEGASDQDLVVVLNQDVEVQQGWLEAMLEINERVPDLGAVGCLAYYPDGKTIQHAGAYLEFPRLVAGHFGYRQQDGDLRLEEREADFVTGAAIGLRVRALRQVGLFDEIFSPGYYEDVDICIRMKRSGWRVLFSPSAKVKHAETQSFKDLRQRLVLSYRNRILFALGYYSAAQIKFFFDAEAEYIRMRAHPDECILLASAYALALARWSSLSQEQRDIHPLDAGRLRAILELRRACIRRLSSHA